MRGSLIALGWLRDVGLVLLLMAGNQIRHDSPVVGITIMGAAAVIFAERFVWSWALCDLREAQKVATSRNDASAD